MGRCTLVNFLKETKNAIEKSGHTPHDIIFIGSEESGYQCTWDEFEKLADFEYDDGFGGQMIATDLIIVFKNKSKMWRGEYDGSEWWEFSTPFVRPKVKKEITKLKGGMCWSDLASIHDYDEDE